jgi:hypothetical protein
VRLRSLLVLALAAGSLVLAPATPAARAADGCAPTAYPGDEAGQAAVAGWMADGAAARGLPGELPVMAALVESGLRNLPAAGGDSAGYFQMKKSIWKASYPGFPNDPEVQLDWFLDHAATARTAPYPPDTEYGEWVADVERPATQYRGRYQPRLADARALIGTACTPVDTTAPVPQVTAVRRQPALSAGGLTLAVACPAEGCTAAVSAVVRVGRQRPKAVPPVALAAGQVASVTVPLRPSTQRLVQRALASGKKVRADVTVTTTDAAGNAATLTQRVRITG